MCKFHVAVFIALCLSAVTGSFVSDTLESVGYFALKRIMIEAGDTELHATCFVEMLKITGTANDVTDLMSDPGTILDKLRQKWRLADFVCSPSGLIVTVLLFGLAVFACCCCCLKRCCKRRTKTPFIIQIPSSHFQSRDASIPYTKMDIE